MGEDTGIQWIEARNAAKPTMHRTSPQQRVIQPKTSTVPLEINPALGASGGYEGTKRKNGFRNLRGELRLRASDREFLIKEVHFGGATHILSTIFLF